MLKILRFPLLLVALALSYPVAAVDIEKGKEINGTCAACHSDNGQGGKKGEYPRIAGQQVKYLETQLRNFRSRTRVNIPMFPYTQERELSDEDIKEISAYLAGIVLDTKQCAGCHGKTGRGRGMFPMLVGQYTNYLQRQVDLYLKGDRPHDEEGTVGLLNALKAQDIQDILAYLTSIQEPKE